MGGMLAPLTASADQWTKIWGTAPFQSTYYGGDDSINAMIMDTSNNILYTGGIHSWQNGAIVLAGQSYNATVGKMDSNGNIIWTDEIGMDRWSDTYGKAIGYDKYGNTYSLVYSWCSPSISGCDIAGDGVKERSNYIVKHDYYGNRQWIKNIGLESDFDARDMLVDKYANIFVVGNSTVNGIRHVAIQKYNYYGTKTGSAVYPSETNETAVDIATDIPNTAMSTINTLYIAFEKDNVRDASWVCCDYTDMGVKRVYSNLTLKWSQTTKNPYWEHPAQVIFNPVTLEVMLFGQETYDRALAAGFQPFAGTPTWYKTTTSSIGVIYVNSLVALNNGQILATGGIGKNGVRGNGWGSDILFARYSATGDLLDIRNHGVYDRRDHGAEIVLDSAENYYIGGAVAGDLDGQSATPNTGTTHDFIMLKNRP